MPSEKDEACFRDEESRAYVVERRGDFCYYVDLFVPRDALMEGTLANEIEVFILAMEKRKMSIQETRG